MPEKRAALFLDDATIYRRGDWQLETYPSGAVLFRDTLSGEAVFGIHPDAVAWVANKLLALAAETETARA